MPFAAGEGLKYRNHKTIFRLRSVRFDGIFSCSQIDYKCSRDLIFQAIDEIFWIFTLFTLAQLFSQKRRYFLYRWRKNSQILNTYLEHNKLGFTAKGIARSQIDDSTCYYYKCFFFLIFSDIS